MGSYGYDVIDLSLLMANFALSLSLCLTALTNPRLDTCKRERASEPAGRSHSSKSKTRATRATVPEFSPVPEARPADQSVPLLRGNPPFRIFCFERLLIIIFMRMIGRGIRQEFLKKPLFKQTETL